MDKEIIIETQNTTDEIFKACKNMLFRMPLFRYIIPIGIVFIVAMNLLAGIIGTDVVEKKTLLETITPFLLVPIIWTFLIFSMLRTTKKKILANPKVTEKQVMTFTANSFLQKGETYQIEYKWKDINKIDETNEWFFIYINKMSAIVLIKDKLKDNQYNELKALFNSLNIKKSLK